MTRQIGMGRSKNEPCNISNVLNALNDPVRPTNNMNHIKKPTCNRAMFRFTKGTSIVSESILLILLLLPLSGNLIMYINSFTHIYIYYFILFPC